MFINVRQRPNTVGLLVGADARTSVPTVRGMIIACVTYYSLVRWVRGRHKARPLQWMGGADSHEGRGGCAHLG